MRTKDIALTGFLVSAILFLYLPDFIQRELNENKAPARATASVVIVRGITEGAAVAMIENMKPRQMYTMKGAATIQRGSEIYLNIPEDLRRQMRIDAESFGARRCVEIQPAKYGWNVVNIHTSYLCKE